jgi:hypothetical protein
VLVHTALVDSELAGAMKELLGTPGGRTLFRYRQNDELVGLSARRLNDYIREYMGEDFTAKDFRTWGGTLLAGVALADETRPRRRRSKNACSPRSCERSASSLETRLRLRALRTSVPRWSSSISTDERSTIFARGIYGPSAHGTWTSIWRNKPY